MTDLLELCSVVKTYEMGETQVQALRGVSFGIPRGQFVSVMGPSGSGKSTLLNIVGCLDRPTAGEYLLDGRPISKLGSRELAEVRNKELGFVFQSFNLLPRLNALQNVALPLIYAGVSPADRHRRAEEALALVGLSERAHHRPQEMSGGQQQRVAVARSLINQPKLLLADEPTGNLDSQSGAEIMEVLCHLHRNGLTIVLVTHETDIAAYSQRTIRFRDGQIVQDVMLPGREVAAR